MYLYVFPPFVEKFEKYREEPVLTYVIRGMFAIAEKKKQILKYLSFGGETFAYAIFAGSLGTIK